MQKINIQKKNITIICTNDTISYCANWVSSIIIKKLSGMDVRKMLNYVIRDRKSDKWLVMIHGIGGSVFTWKRQMDEFPEYNLLLVDLPGHGESQLKNFKVTIKNVNNEIKKTLDVLNIKEADFVVMSLGSLVAAYFASTYPEYVHSLIMGGAVLNIVGFSKILFIIAQKIKKFLPYRFVYNMFASIMMPKKNHSLSRKIFVRESLKMQKGQFLEWVSYLSGAINPYKLLNKLKELNIKMFFISGDEDCCFINGAKQACNYLKNAKMHIIKHCGHVCSIEKAKEFNAEVSKYLVSISAPEAA